MDRKYAGDYEARSTLKGIVYDYKGDYYRIDGDKKTGSLLPKLFCLSGLSFAFWLAAGFLNNEGSHFFTSALSYAICLIPTVYLFLGEFSCMSYHRLEKLERKQYDRSVRRVERSAGGLLFCQGAALTGELVFLAVKHEPAVIRGETAYMILMLCAVFFALFLKRLLKSVSIVVENRQDKVELDQ